MYIRDEDYYEKNKVEIKFGKKVVVVDFKNKEVIFDDGEKVKYDKFLIVIGGKFFILFIKGFEFKNVFIFIKFDDVKVIDEVIKNGVKKVVVIGVGLSGFKAVEVFIKRNLDVIVVEFVNRILGFILDLEVLKIVQDEFEKYGIVFKFEIFVDEIIGDGKVEKVKFKNGEVLDVDIVVFVIGVVLNIDFLKGIEFKINCGIVVNNKMEINIEDVYAVGDCVEGYDFVFEQ